MHPTAGAHPSDPTAPPLRAKSRCGSLVLAGMTPQGDVWTPLRCKSWGCERCRGWLAAKWSATLTACVAFVPRAFVTITLSPAELLRRGISLTDYAAQCAFLRLAWSRLVRAARREFGNCSFLRVYEYHSGRWDARHGVYNHRLHIHALVDSPAPAGGYSMEAFESGACGLGELYERERDWWAQAASRFGLGRTLAYTVTSMSVKMYLLKYTTKLKPAAYRHKVRMIGTSRDVRHPEAEPATGIWGIVRDGDQKAKGTLFDRLTQTARAFGEVEVAKGSNPVAFGPAGILGGCGLTVDGQGRWWLASDAAGMAGSSDAAVRFFDCALDGRPNEALTSACASSVKS